MFSPKFIIRLTSDLVEAQDQKSGAKISLTPDITVNGKDIVTDVGGMRPEGRAEGITYTPFSSPLSSDKQERLIVLVLAQTIHKLNEARKGTFLGFSIAPEVEFRLSRDVVHLADFLVKNREGYGARKASVVPE